jgi:hypothetical protein
MREFCKQFRILALSLIENISAHVSYFPTSCVFSCRSSVLDGCESGFMVFENSWLDPHSSMTLRSLASPPDKTLREDAVTSRASYSRSLLNSLPPLQGCSPLKPYLNCYYCVEFIAAAFKLLSLFCRFSLAKAFISWAVCVNHLEFVNDSHDDIFLLFPIIARGVR